MVFKPEETPKCWAGNTDETRHLILKEKLVVEPSGATALAAVMAGKLKLPKGPAVAILSGGNADLKMILNF